MSILRLIILTVSLSSLNLAIAADSKIKATIVSASLEHPWGMAFLPDGRILITERPGRLRIYSSQGLSNPVSGLPKIKAKVQGGLLDIALDPDFTKNKYVYFTYSAKGKGGIGTELGRGKFINDKIVNFKVLFRLSPKSGTGYHFGSRIVFDGKGHIFITLGDRGERNRAQNLADHAGSVIRLNLDGSIPRDNPFIGLKNKQAEIYSYGHRNPQGAIWHSGRKELWIHEHGPQGGDEINIIKPGKNYGWPLATYGAEYVTGFKIGKTHIKNTVQPIHYWVPSIAPSGMALYSGNRFKDWQGDLLVGSLKFQQLVRLQLRGKKIIKEQRLFKGKFGRIRDVKVDKQGYIWLLTDSSKGKLIRLESGL